MKSYPTLIALLMLMLLACRNKQQTENSDNILIDTKTDQRCYVYINNKDSASLTFTNIDNRITGQLIYNLYEKDLNTGTITGKMQGDTLIADYTFEAEGGESVRQVVFLKSNGKLLSGFGEIVEENGQIKFKDISKLKFDNILTFVPVACK